MIKLYDSVPFRNIKPKEYMSVLNNLGLQRTEKDKNKKKVKVTNTLSVYLSEEKLNAYKLQAESIGESLQYVLRMIYDKSLISEMQRTDVDDRINLCLIKHKLKKEDVSKERKQLSREMNKRVMLFLKDLKSSNPDITQELIAKKLKVNRNRIFTAIYRY